MMLIFRFILVFGISTRTCLQALMFRKLFYFSHHVPLNTPVSILWLNVPVSLREEAHSALKGPMSP